MTVTDEMKQIIDLMYDLKITKNAAEEEYGEKRKAILDYFLNNIKSGATLKGEVAQVVKSDKVTTTYYTNKLKENLDVEIFNEAVSRTYNIPDIEKMIKMLKKYKVPAKEFKQLLEINEQINVEVLNNMYELGDITDDDLLGCYETNITHAIKVTAKKDDEWNDDPTDDWGDDNNDDW